jgi:hypothetical protein
MSSKRHFFALSPNSTRRRMASGRDAAGSRFLIHRSNPIICSGCSRTSTPSPRPVAGRPRFFFGISLIDFAMNKGYQKNKPRGSANFRLGPNPSHNGAGGQRVFRQGPLPDSLPTHGVMARCQRGRRERAMERSLLPARFFTLTMRGNSHEAIPLAADFGIRSGAGSSEHPLDWNR